MRNFVAHFLSYYACNGVGLGMHFTQMLRLLASAKENLDQEKNATPSSPK